MWRLEQGRVHAAEVTFVTERLAEVDEHGIPAEYLKPKKAKATTASKADLAHRLDVVAKILTEDHPAEPDTDT